MVTAPAAPSASNASPSLFGFRIRTDVPLHFLREGGGVEPLDIVVARERAARPDGAPLGEWPLHGTARPESAAIYAHPGGFEYWTTDAGRFVVDLAGGRIELPPDGDEILREQRLLGMPMLLSFAHRGDISLHAAAVVIAGGAIVLAAPSRFGKTTLAFAFHERGHRLLSEDLVCFRPDSGEVIPGPALARLRPDVYSGTPPAGFELVARRPDRLFLAPPAGRRGPSAPVPLRGLVFLREGDAVALRQANTVEAVKDLWHLGFRMPTAEGRAESFRQLTRLASGVPIWNLYRPLRLDALEETIQAILGLAVGASPHRQ